MEETVTAQVCPINFPFCCLKVSTLVPSSGAIGGAFFGAIYGTNGVNKNHYVDLAQEKSSGDDDEYHHEPCASIRMRLHVFLFSNT